jgi:hypothetical protein
MNPAPVTETTIDVWAEQLYGPHWGGSLHSHILELVVFARSSASAWLTPADAVGGEAALAGAVRGAIDEDGEIIFDADHLADVLARAFPGAQVMFHLDWPDQNEDDEAEGDSEEGPPPRIIHSELSRDCVSDSCGWARMSQRGTRSRALWEAPVRQLALAAVGNHARATF